MPNNFKNDMTIYAQLIAKRLNLNETGVDNTIALLDLGCTIPFIAATEKSALEISTKYRLLKSARHTRN